MFLLYKLYRSAFWGLLLLGVLAGPARAQTPTFQGRLTDARTGEGLPGASVVFPDLKQGAATDAQGRFAFRSLPRGRFLVQLTSLGYNTLSLTVDTGAGQPLEAQLTPAATEIGQVVVTGVSQATQLRRSPVPTTVVDRARLNQQAATNAIDAIAHAPGLNQISTGPGIGKPVVRGLGYNRVVTLNNGARQEGQQWGDEHGVEIDEFSIDRVEITKGPGSLLYGSDAMAGVLNFLPPDPVAEGRVLGQITANYQTNNRQQGYSLLNAGNLGGVSWLVRGSRKVAGDYRNAYDGRVFNSGFNEWNADGYLGLNRTWGYSHLRFSSFNQHLGLVEGARDSASGRFVQDVALPGGQVASRVVPAGWRGYGLAVPDQLINHLRLGLDNSFIIGQQGGRLTVQVNYQQNRRREYGEVLAPRVPNLYFQLRTVDWALRYFLPEMNGWSLALGTSGFRQQNRNLGAEFLIPAYNSVDGGVFGVLKKTLGRLDLSGGLRYDRRWLTAQNLFLDADGRPVPAGTAGAEVKFPGFVNNVGNVSGSLGAAFNASERLTLKANLSRGFRAASIAELGANGVHEGTVRFEQGDPGLRPETSLQGDLGVSYVTDHLRLAVDGFANRVNNYIFARRVLNRAGQDSLVSTGPDIGLFRFQQGLAQLYGGEVSLDLHPHPLDWLHVENSFSMVRARQLDVPADERFLPFIPADRLLSELRGNFRRPGKRLTNLYARVQLEQNFAQHRFYAAFNTETATPAYTLLHAGLGGDLTNRQGQTLFSLYLTANNLFDVAYQSHLSRLKYTDFDRLTGRQGVFNMGRTVSLKLVVPLRLR